MSALSAFYAKIKIGHVEAGLRTFDKYYPYPEEIRFIREDGLERSLKEVLEEAFAILRQSGSLRFGKDLAGKEIKTYQDLVDLKLDKTEEYATEPLKVGVYVRRDILTRIFAKYKAKVTMLEQEEKQSTK